MSTESSGRMTERTLRELDAAIAEKVMELAEVGYYRRVSCHTPNWERCEKEDVTPDFPKWKAELYFRFGPHRLFYEVPRYTTDPAASKQLREKLAERWRVDTSLWTSIVQKRRACCNLIDTNLNVAAEARADTEELAVALCAAKAYNIPNTEGGS